jgi:mono/diheme cytochrome c family protein
MLRIRASMKRSARPAWSLTALGIASCGFNANAPRAFAPVASLDEPPPPIAGGTLLVTHNQRFAIASDPDRSAIFVVSLDATTSDASRVRRIDAPPRSEPGRAIEDGTGAVHVVLRGASAVLTIDPAQAALIEQRSVCVEPRGITFDPEEDLLWIACARGELLSMRTRDAEVVRREKITPDARDVVLGPDRTLWVSYFRTAAIDVFDRSLRRVSSRSIAQTSLSDRAANVRRYQPSALWRMRASEHGVAVAHQFAFIGPEREEDTQDGEYSYSREQRGWRDPCDNSVAPASVRMITNAASAMRPAMMLTRGVLPVDVAVSPAGQVAVAFAGELSALRAHGPQVSLSPARAHLDEAWPTRCIPEDRERRFEGQVVAVDFVGEELVVQTREPAQLFVGDRRIELSNESRRDTGHDLFHGDLGGGIACASCHSEGADDGHVWHFLATGPLRTPALYSLRPDGPYHRRGDVPSLRSLVDLTMRARMAGPVIDEQQLSAVRRWITRIRVPSTVTADPAIERGRAVFAREDLRCAQCHSGESYSDGRAHALESSSVTRWMTPSLVGLSLRPPYLHDGCATTIEGIFLRCDSGDEHRRVRALRADERSDLVSFLQSL